MSKQRLTDNYDKTPGSNISKLLEILELPFNAIPFDRIRIWRGVDEAQGKTLDNIGVNVDQQRGAVNDVVYRSLIRSKVLRNNSNGTINELIDLLAFVLQTNRADIKITEGWEMDPIRPGYVLLSGITATSLAPLGLSTSQLSQILNEAAMAGVRVEVEFIYNTWGVVGQYTWGQIGQYTWAQVKEQELSGEPLPD